MRKCVCVREREIQRGIDTYICIYECIYMYIYRERGRYREREREGEVEVYRGRGIRIEIKKERGRERKKERKRERERERAGSSLRRRDESYRQIVPNTALSLFYLPSYLLFHPLPY